MKEISLRNKFLMYTAVTTMVIMVVSALLIEVSYRNGIIQSSKEKLELHIFNLLAVAEFSNNGISLPTILSNPKFNEDNHSLWAVVLNDKQEPLWQSLSIEELPSQFPLSSNIGHWLFSDITINQELFHTASYAIAWQNNGKQQTYSLIVGSHAKLLDTTIATFRLWLLLGFCMITITLLSVQTWVLNRVFNPIKQLESEINQLEKGDQDQLHLHYPLELKGVTKNLNGLITKEYKQREKYRASMADLAHSLKTPVAIIKSEISKLPENKALNQAIHRINDTIEYQLRRAVISGHTLVSSGTNIKDTADMVVSALNKVYQHKPLEIELNLPENAIFKGDENDLMEIFGNLLDNAYKHAKSHIRVDTNFAKMQLDIVIEDDGMGIPEEDIEPIFNRGKRLDESQSGQGIGLAIVHNIVDSYKGDIHLSRSQLGGARFHIRFFQEM